MKKFFTNLDLKKMIKPLVFFFFVFACMVNANAQTLTSNKITAPAVVSGVGSLNCDVIIGSFVNFTNGTTKASSCDVTYSWESASDVGFTKNVVQNLANTKDYKPGRVISTTYFRRIASSKCPNDDFGATSTTSGIKITIN